MLVQLHYEAFRRVHVAPFQNSQILDHHQRNIAAIGELPRGVPVHLAIEGAKLVVRDTA